MTPVMFHGHRLALTVCTISEVDDGGAVSKENRVFLVDGWAASPIGDYSEGWEWGGAWTIEGVLGDHVVLVHEISSNTDVTTRTVHAFELRLGVWEESYRSPSRDDLELTVSRDQRSATITWCEVASCDTTPKKTVELRSDGRSLTHVP